MAGGLYLGMDQLADQQAVPAVNFSGSSAFIPNKLGSQLYREKSGRNYLPLLTYFAREVHETTFAI